MKISEFADMNQVTTKMLRHYDKIGLLKPNRISDSGYRLYEKSQSTLLNWILIFKNLDFSLQEIKELLCEPADKSSLVTDLVQKRIEVTNTLNEQIQKRLQIDKLIQIIKREGIQMDKKINLVSIKEDSINDIKKNMPNMELFVENVKKILSRCNNEDVTFIRTDLAHFKEVNDNYGYIVGDKVIVQFYKIIESRFKAYQADSPIARAGGDEFVIFIKGNKDKALTLANEVIDDLNSFDFDSIGCKRKQGCYIGTITTNSINVGEPRKLIDETIEALYNARNKGINEIDSVLIK